MYLFLPVFHPLLLQPSMLMLSSMLSGSHHLRPLGDILRNGYFHCSETNGDLPFWYRENIGACLVTGFRRRFCAIVISPSIPVRCMLHCLRYCLKYQAYTDIAFAFDCMCCALLYLDSRRKSTLNWHLAAYLTPNLDLFWHWCPWRTNHALLFRFWRY